MKCKSCKEDVPPKFVHALSKNTCPLCGETIMDEKLQSTLNDLKKAMDAGKDYADEVADWLRSNYSLVYSSTASMKSTIATPEIKQHTSPTQTPFIRRSGVDPIKMQQVIKNIQQIDGDFVVEDAADDVDNLYEEDLPIEDSLFDNKESQVLELERLKRFHKQQASIGGGTGKIRRVE